MSKQIILLDISMFVLLLKRFCEPFTNISREFATLRATSPSAFSFSCKSESTGIVSAVGLFSMNSLYTACTHLSITDLSSADKPYLPPTIISHREMIKSDLSAIISIGFSKRYSSIEISIGFMCCSELLAIRISCPLRA